MVEPRWTGGLTRRPRPSPRRPPRASLVSGLLSFTPAPSPWGAPDRRPLPTSLPPRGRRRPRRLGGRGTAPPFRPASVVGGDVVLADQMPPEQHPGGRPSGAAGGHHRPREVDPRLVERGAEGLAPLPCVVRVEQAPLRQV